MTKDRIRKLATLISDSAPYFQRLGVSAMSETRQPQVISRDNKILFDPSFGWQLVRHLVNANKIMPNWIEEDYLRRAYAFEKGRAAWDYNIIEAIGIAHPDNWYRKAIFQACLITDTPFEAIGNRLGYDEQTVRAFEQLFFNIRDRRHEHTYIGSIVYETGILVEHQQNYFIKENTGTILIRTAAKAGLEPALALAGLSPSRRLSQDISDTAAQVEQRIMDNALELANYGMLNQPSRGINNAKSLVQAAKASGQSSGKTQEAIGVSALGTSLMEEIVNTAETTIHAISEARDKRQHLIDAAKAADSKIIDIPN